MIIPDAVTVQDVAKALGTTDARVRGLLKGVEPSLTVQNGRVRIYSLADVRKALREQHSAILTFLGVLSPEQSYDALIQEDFETSKEEV
jgi:hypothetical protein